jgi:hypothetical protein
MKILKAALKLVMMIMAITIRKTKDHGKSNNSLKINEQFFFHVCFCHIKKIIKLNFFCQSVSPFLIIAERD